MKTRPQSKLWINSKDLRRNLGKIYVVQQSPIVFILSPCLPCTAPWTSCNSHLPPGTPCTFHETTWAPCASYEPSKYPLYIPWAYMNLPMNFSVSLYFASTHVVPMWYLCVPPYVLSCTASLPPYHHMYFCVTLHATTMYFIIPHVPQCTSNYPHVPPMHRSHETGDRWKSNYTKVSMTLGRPILMVFADDVGHHFPYIALVFFQQALVARPVGEAHIQQCLHWTVVFYSGFSGWDAGSRITYPCISDV